MFSTSKIAEVNRSSTNAIKKGVVERADEPGLPRRVVVGVLAPLTDDVRFNLVDDHHGPPAG